MDPLHNARVKRYPDGSSELLIGSRPFGGGNIVAAPRDDGPLFDRRLPVDPDDQEEARYRELERIAIELDDAADDRSGEAQCRAASVSRSVRRARKALRDLARANEWAYFVTFTFSPERCDRYDPVEVGKHLRHWLGNNVRRKGLKYVLVLEHHKDGAIHGHGLINDALPAVDSGTMSVPGRKAPVKARSEAHRAALEREGGHPVYNLPDWGWGFSTAIPLYGEKDAAINYVCKYIGKEMSGTDGAERGTPEKIGGRWYYSGGDLQRPTVEWFDVDPRDYEDMPGWYAPCDGAWGRFLTLRVDASGEVLPPYVRGENAEHGRGGDQPPEEGVTVRPGPSSDHVEGSAVAMAGGPSDGRDGDASDAALYAHAPRAKVPKTAHLTNSGLSSRAASPGPPRPEGGGGPK